MKVLFCGLKYDYGKIHNGLSMEYVNFYDCLTRMPAVEADFFGVDEETYKVGADAANALLIKKVNDWQPDLLFCFLLGEELKKQTIEHITKKTKTKTLNWFADDHWRVPVYSRFWAPLFTMVATTDSKAPEIYKSYGIKNVIKTQWAANIARYKPSGINKQEPEISFVGQNYGERSGYVDALNRAGLPVYAFGGGWDSGRLEFEKMLEVFSQSRINLNFSGTYFSGFKSFIKLSAKFFVRKEAGHYKFSLHHLRDNWLSAKGTQRRPLKGRVFEVPACGGFLMTQACDENINEYYKPGEELIVFNNAADLIEKCRYYLTHDTERQKIARAGFEKTIKYHTYQQRFLEIFHAMNLK